MNSMLQEWCIFYRSAKKLASPWFPWQKANRICPLDFGLLQKKKHCGAVVYDTDMFCSASLHKKNATFTIFEASIQSTEVKI